MGDSDSQPVTKKEQPDYPFPKYVVLILGNEFCERYSYYGLRSVLIIFLSYFIGFDDDTSTVIYHGFTVLAYLFPLLGAAIADGYWGKFKTIFLVSMIYACGMFLVSISAIPLIGNYAEGQFRTTNMVLTLLGLFTVAFGTGGIKPCVSAFGGDQFKPDDDKNTTLFFDLFYWSINAGSLLSTFVSPVLRQTTCGSLGTETSCFFLAFLIPAVLMCVAIVFFLLGNRYYRKVPPSGTNIFWEFIKCCWYGVFCKIPKDSPNQEHWLYGAYGKIEPWIIRDSTYVVRVLVMFAPLPLYRAAFDLQGSRWTQQAIRMNGYIASWLHVAPDQAQILNAFFILSFIPIFNQLYRIVDRIVYSCTGTPNFVTRLRKMCVGLVFAAGAFVIAAVVQSQIDKNLTVSPGVDSEITLNVLNFSPEEVSGQFKAYNAEYGLNELENEDFLILPGQKSYTSENVATSEILVNTNGNYSFNYQIGNTPSQEKFYNIKEGREVWNLAIFPDDITVQYPGFSSKDSDGRARIITVSTLQRSRFNITFTCQEEDTPTCKDQKFLTEYLNACDRDYGYEEHDNKETEHIPCVDGYLGDDMEYQITLRQGQYTVALIEEDGTEFFSQSDVEFGTGAAYTIGVYGQDSTRPNLSIIQDINTNDVSLLWIIPQFFVLTVGEVMINITGLEFAYTQAPKTLKAVLQSFWLLTASIGNIITMFVAEFRIMPTMVGEYLLFAGMILACDVIFSLLSIFYYEYVKDDEFDNFDYPAEYLAMLYGVDPKGQENAVDNKDEKEDDL